MKRLFLLSFLLGACTVDHTGIGEASEDVVLDDASLDVSTDALSDSSDALDSDADVSPPDAGCPTEALRCEGSAEIQCIDGIDTELRRCAFGCFDLSRCAALAPLNIPAEVLSRGAGAIVVGAGMRVRFNADDGSIIGEGGEELRRPGDGDMSGIHFQRIKTDPVNIGVFSANGMRIEAGAELIVVGRSSVAFAIGGDVQILGTLDVGAREQTGGPGAGNGGVRNAGEDAPGQPNSGGEEDENVDERLFGADDWDAAGGGGGANTGDGGAGGTENDTVANGGAFFDLGDGEPLVGGGGGGAGGDGGSGDGDPGGNGGGGGGAVQISATGRITITGVIRSPGGEGFTASAAGGGGGAGGTIILEAARIEGEGQIAANGGSGALGANAGNGIRGGDTSMPTSIDGAGDGGGGTQIDGSRGNDDTDADNRTQNASGGGGAAGRVILRARDNVFTGDVSPLIGSGSTSSSPNVR